MTHRSQYVCNLTMPLWEFEPETGDEERAKWDAPPLAEQIREAAKKQ